MAKLAKPDQRTPGGGAATMDALKAAIDIPNHVAIIFFGAVNAAVIRRSVSYVAAFEILRVAVNEHEIASLIVVALREAVTAGARENPVAVSIAGSA